MTPRPDDSKPASTVLVVVDHHVVLDAAAAPAAVVGGVPQPEEDANVVISLQEEEEEDESLSSSSWPGPDASTAGVIVTPDKTAVISALPTVVLVDPFSTGVLLQQRLFDMGYPIILVWSDRTQPSARTRHLERTIPNQSLLRAIVTHNAHDPVSHTVDQILQVLRMDNPSNRIGAVMCGSEHGVLLEDALAEELRQRRFQDDTSMIRSSGILPTRQTKVDKHAQANLLRAAGLDAVREQLVRTPEEVQAFLQSHHNQPRMVVKPQTGAGSVGVTLCDSHAAVWEAYHKIMAGEHKSHCGNKYKHYTQAGVLLQEYLDGDEYIVNSVILNGEIKTTAMFQYDKRPCNGASFVCFSKELVVPGNPQRPELDEILNYAERVLRAVGFQNGAIHAEIMYIPHRGPVLVELNCRLHGGNAAWVRPANLCMGYDQLSVFMDAYLNQGQGLFRAIPARPERALAYCQQVKMRSFVEGVLDYVIPEQWAKIQALSSYLEHTFGVLPGERIRKTIDMPSVPGEITLVHSSPDILAKDYETLNEILREGIFQVVGGVANQHATVAADHRCHETNHHSTTTTTTSSYPVKYPVSL